MSKKVRDTSIEVLVHSSLQNTKLDQLLSARFKSKRHWYGHCGTLSLCFCNELQVCFAHHLVESYVCSQVWTSCQKQPGFGLKYPGIEFTMPSIFIKAPEPQDPKHQAFWHYVLWDPVSPSSLHFVLYSASVVCCFGAKSIECTQNNYYVQPVHNSVLFHKMKWEQASTVCSSLCFCTCEERPELCCQD